MRIHRMRFDIWLCCLLSWFAALGTAKVTEHLSASTYDDYVEQHTAVQGEAGSLAGEDIFRAQSVEDLLNNDVFTVISEGASYQNDGSGFYEDYTLYNLELPSKERVAALINVENIQGGEDPFSGEKVLPIGKVVWADLSQNQTFLSQIEIGYPLSRYDFYIDMAGNSVRLSEDYRSSNYVLVTQIITIIVCIPIFHVLGVKLRIFPPILPSKKEKRSPRI